MVLPHAKYAPEYRIEIGGDAVPPAMRASVVQINYQDGIEGADRVEVRLANDRLQWLDHPLLQVDNEFNLAIGYAPDPLEDVFFGEITGINVSFPNSGIPTVTVVAHDLLQRLTHGTKDRDFALSTACLGKFPLPDVAIAELVGFTNLLVPFGGLGDLAGAGLSFLTLLIAYLLDPLEAKKAIRTQNNQSDFEFLSKLAKENGCEMFIDHSKEPHGRRLRFQLPIIDRDVAVSLKWGESLIDFTPKISTVGQVDGVSATVWLPSIQSEFHVELSWDFDRAAFNLQVFPNLPGFKDDPGKGKRRGVIKIPTISAVTTPKEILGELLPRLNNRQTASGSTIGDPRIKASKVINIDGLGEQFGGLYRVTSAIHTIDGSGYRTQFDARKEVWFDVVDRIKETAKSAVTSIGVQGQTFG
jgi:phage protein D